MVETHLPRKKTKLPTPWTPSNPKKSFVLLKGLNKIASRHDYILQNAYFQTLQMRHHVLETNLTQQVILSV